MTSQKIENVLNLALDATQEERLRSGNLEVGYDEACIPGHWIRWTGLRWMSSHC